VPLAPDAPFVMRTAAQVVAWYDAQERYGGAASFCKLAASPYHSITGLDTGGGLRSANWAWCQYGYAGVTALAASNFAT